MKTASITIKQSSSCRPHRRHGPGNGPSASTGSTGSSPGKVMLLRHSGTLTPQCRNMRRSPGTTSTPWGLCPSSPTMLEVGHCARRHKIWCWLARPTSRRQLDSFLSLWRPHVGGCSGCWNTLVAMADSKLSALYYSPRGYWKGLAAFEKLASAAKVTEQQAKDWLKRQAIWQIYLPAPRCVPRPKFDKAVPIEVHKADLLFLPHDPVGQRTFCYALTVVDVASRYKEAQPLTSKTAAEVADGLARIYKRSPLRWPKLLQVLTLGASSWVRWASCSPNTGSRSDVDVLTSTGTKASWSTGTGPWLSGSSMLRRWASLRVRDQQSGWLDCLAS